MGRVLPHREANLEPFVLVSIYPAHVFQHAKHVIVEDCHFELAQRLNAKRLLESLEPTFANVLHFLGFLAKLVESKFLYRLVHPVNCSAPPQDYRGSKESLTGTSQSFLQVFLLVTRSTFQYFRQVWEGNNSPTGHHHRN